MKLFADSGSTKTDWCIVGDSNNSIKISTQGINPFHMNKDEIFAALNLELLPQIESCVPNEAIEEIYFYGAGCTEALSPIVRDVILEVFPHADVVEVDSDLLGAAKALCGRNEGIACILGTGANSCLYDGKEIVANVSPMGFILGDEGSGAVLGKTFVNELYKGQHKEFIQVFEAETGLKQVDVIQRTYREPLPNRFLASLSVFIANHIESEAWLYDMVVDCFKLFFKRNIAHYNRKDLPVNFVGSIAYYYQKPLREAAELEGFKVGKILKSPL